MLHGYKSGISTKITAISISVVHVLCLTVPKTEAGPTPCLPSLRGCVELKANIESYEPDSWGPQMPQSPIATSMPLTTQPGNSYLQLQATTGSAKKTLHTSKIF